MWSALPQDFIYAWRRVRRQPGFALVIVLTLDSAMGVNTSFFSMFNAGALKPWPVRDPDAVVAIHPQVSLAEWRHWTDHARSFFAREVVRLQTRCGGQRQPEIASAAPGPVESFRGNTDDGERDTVERDRSPEDVRV